MPVVFAAMLRPEPFYRDTVGTNCSLYPVLREAHELSMYLVAITIMRS